MIASGHEHIQRLSGPIKAPIDEQLLAYADEVQLPAECHPSYGDLGASFDDLFQDPEELTRLEALSFHGVLKPHGVQSVLDCTCGTGIQALGLAALSYDVSASDISNEMIAIVQAKAAQSDLQIETKQADFRSLHAWVGHRFDAVITGGNSISLLENLEEVDQVLKSAIRLLNPHGVVVIGGRDYGLVRDAGETILPRRSRFRNGNPEWIFDLRLFGAQRVRVIHTFISVVNGRWDVQSYVKSHLYLSADELVARMRLSGLTNIEVLDQRGLQPYEGEEWFLAVGEK